VIHPFVRNPFQLASKNIILKTMHIAYYFLGDDIRGMRDIGVDHIIFDYMFAPIGSNVEEMSDMSKELSKYAR
jgi:hypothetical protein